MSAPASGRVLDRLADEEVIRCGGMWTARYERVVRCSPPQVRYPGVTPQLNKCLQARESCGISPGPRGTAGMPRQLMRQPESATFRSLAVLFRRD